MPERSREDLLGFWKLCHQYSSSAVLCSKVYQWSNDRIAKRPDTWPNVRAISLRCNRVWQVHRTCVSLVGLLAPRSNVQVLAPPVNTCYECEGMLVANHKCKVKYYTNAGLTVVERGGQHAVYFTWQLRSVWQQACSWLSPLSC